MSSHSVSAPRSSGFGAFLLGLLTLAILAAAAYVAWFGVPSLPSGSLTINGQPLTAPQVRDLAPSLDQIAPAPAAPPIAQPAQVEGALEAAPAGVTSGAGHSPAPAEAPAGITGAIDAAPQPVPAGKGVGGLAGGLNLGGGATGAVDAGGGITGGAGAMTK
jgi:hypothetical protein